MPTTLKLASTEQPSAEQDPFDSAESRMRRALGLPLPDAAGGAAKRAPGPTIGSRASRHAGPPVNRVALAEAALASERQAREQAERQLREAEAALLKATTKLGQAEFARDEAVAALAAEKTARAAAESAARDATEAKLQALSTASAPAAPERRVADPVPGPRRRGRPPGSTNRPVAAVKPVQPETEPDEQPIEWWVPGWQNRRRAG